MSAEKTAQINLIVDFFLSFPDSLLEQYCTEITQLIQQQNLVRDAKGGLINKITEPVEVPNSCQCKSGICSMCDCCYSMCDNCVVNLTPQAEDESVSISSGSSVLNSTVQQNLEFLDSDLSVDHGIRSQLSEATIADQAIINADLSEFLSRPVRIANFSWLETDAVGVNDDTINPWHLFFSDARIKYKLNNYAFISCNLRIKVMINASPFYYGLMGGMYLPNQGLTLSTITNDAGTRFLIPYSQRPHGWIEPQSNTGFEMTLPFFWHKNWLRISHYQDFIDMGRLDFLVYSALTSANGAVGTGVTIQVYAWAEDVKISGPTLGLALAIQARDEYAAGPISSVASAVAAIASKFKGAPIIGPLARASEIGAKMVAMGATLFGYTNVPVLDAPVPFRNVPFPQLASSEISYPIEKLTLDPKAELTVDNRVVGLDGTDELDMLYLKTKESYWTSMTFSTSNAVDDVLFFCDINPCCHDAVALASGEIVQMTPICWLAQMFRHWRGDLIFRFKVVCSKYHRGRIRIVFDPSGYAAENVVTDAVSSTVVFNKIIDISETTDVEFRVPYMQALPWLTTYAPTVANNRFTVNNGAGGSYVQEGVTNGALAVRVQNILSAPTATSTIGILVFVRGAENLEFANPQDTFGGLPYSLFPTQSLNEHVPDPTVVSPLLTRGTADSRYLVNFGEKISSLRQLMRRSCFDLVWAVDKANDAETAIMIILSKTKWPKAYGYDPNGYGHATGIVSGTAKPFNWNARTYYHHIATAFCATRGSMNWSFNVAGKSVGHFRACRTPGSSLVAASPYVQSTLSSANTGVAYQNIIQSYYQIFDQNCVSGASLVHQGTQSGLNFVHPMYSAYKMYSTSPALADGIDAYTDSLYDAVAVDVLLDRGNKNPTGTLSAQTWEGIHISQYASIGLDYNCLFFVNVPTYFKYASTPITP